MAFKSHLGSMSRRIAGLALLLTASAASASTDATDFGLRFAPGSAPARPAVVSGQASMTRILPAGASASLSAAVAIASRLGRVTSTIRTLARNRAIGGARNSYHLSGRAIDVVPRAGVRHADIEAALRSAGFYLIESLDEGDHSHFAFGASPAQAPSFQAAALQQNPATQRRMLTAPGFTAR